jgi:hypothetical protein
MEEEPQYITINEMIKRDLDKKIETDTKPKQTVYQIQAKKNDNTISVVPVGEFSFIPTTKIIEITDGKYLCKLLAMVIPQSDINNDIKCMISFFISRKKRPEKVLCRLSYSYITSERQFCVCLEKKSTTEMIEKYTEYHGNEESIYLLTNIILRKDVKKKIFD